MSSLPTFHMSSLSEAKDLPPSQTTSPLHLRRAGPRSGTHGAGRGRHGNPLPHTTPCHTPVLANSLYFVCPGSLCLVCPGSLCLVFPDSDRGPRGAGPLANSDQKTSRSSQNHLAATPPSCRTPIRYPWRGARAERHPLPPRDSLSHAPSWPIRFTSSSPAPFASSSPTPIGDPGERGHAQTATKEPPAHPKTASPLHPRRAGPRSGTHGAGRGRHGNPYLYATPRHNPSSCGTPPSSSPTPIEDPGSGVRSAGGAATPPSPCTAQ